MGILDSILKGAQQGATMRAESEQGFPKQAAAITMPEDAVDAGLMMAGGPFGKLGKLGGLGLAAAGYAPDADAGWLLGPKGAARAGLAKIYDRLMREQEAFQKLQSPKQLIQASGDPEIWTSLDGKPRTFLPNTNKGFSVPLQEDTSHSFTDLMDVPPQILKAYPEVADLQANISRYNPGYTVNGSSWGGKGQIDINMDGPNPFSTAIHEFTHNIPQHTEQFTPGSNLTEARKQVNNYQALLSQANKAKEGMLRATDPEMRKMFEFKFEQAQQALQNNPVTRRMGGKVYPLSSDPQDMQDLVYDIYRTNAGEHEARMMQQAWERQVEPAKVKSLFGGSGKMLSNYKQGGLVQYSKEKCSCQK